MQILLLLSVFVIATCGLVYELIAGTIASYLLGDSVTQFSTIIGTYLCAMGIGSWLSRYVKKNLLETFVQVEILVGVIGGFSAIFLFTAFDQVSSFRILLYLTVVLIGALVGIEIPLLLKILKDQLDFSDLVSKVFTFDYLGALVASILFPLYFVPSLGLVRTSFLFGIFNVAIAMWLIFSLQGHFRKHFFIKAQASCAFVLLVFGFLYSESYVKFAEASAYEGSVIYSQSTKYQRIVLTKSGRDIRLFLNNNLQFSSLDEYRYHEALVHPALASLDSLKKVLIIGGGDGLALREVLKYPSVEAVTLVDLDPEMTKLFMTSPTLVELNNAALSSPKVQVVNNDAFVWVRDEVARDAALYDAILIDLPDPSNFSLGKLYSQPFYELLGKMLASEGLIVVQSTSPFVARKSFWCVNATLESVGFLTAPYHAFIPSFGDWGFVIAGKQLYRPPSEFPSGLKFINSPVLTQLFNFPPDMSRVPTKVQRLNDQALVHYFDQEWSEYLQ